MRPGRRGAVASCGRGLARRFRPPRRGVPAPALEGWARRGLCAGGCSEVGAEAAGGAAATQQVLLEGEWSLGARDGEGDLCGRVGTGGRGNLGLNGKGAPEDGRAPWREGRGNQEEAA